MKLASVEKTWRLMWMRAIARSLPGPRIVDANWSARGRRTLFVRYERIGDMIMATGMIRVLAQAAAGGKVDVLANPTTAPVLEGNPHVGRVFTLDRKSWKSYREVGKQLAAEHYEVVVDGRINNPPVFTSTPMLMLASRAEYRIGVGGGNNDHIYNVRVRAYDRSTPYIEGSKPLAVPFGIDVASVDWQPEIFLQDDEREEAAENWRAAGRAARRRISALETDGTDSDESVTPDSPWKRLLVNLSASEPKRRWQDENFVEVLRKIREQAPGLPIVVIGLPSEWPSVHRIAGAIGAHPVQTPRLRQAFALVGTSDMVFTPDTSISHAASAFRKPAVVLLKRDHHPYAPYNIPGENVFWDGNEIHSLPSNKVLDALERLVADYGGGPQSARRN
ncbi:MAG TPA: glycosyltransferase family 9 protein [Gemmatimonadaceae bacterium]|nr:glycosyltransferase family 9 protein [Gemmatimonadaceae bacterium]